MRFVRFSRLRLLLLILLLETVLFVSISSNEWLASLRSRLVELRGAAVDREARIFSNIVARFQFATPDSLRRWEEKIFRGKTLYEVTTENGNTFLKTSSKAASSGLYAKIHVEPLPDVFLTWWWRAVRFPEKKEPLRLSNRGEDDFSARVYVVFPGSNFFNSNVIEYIWDEAISAGTQSSSPFSDRVKLFVIRTGPPADANGGWKMEERNVYDDYKHLFGKPPDRAIGAIAIMSDSDNTKTESASDFGDIVIHQKTKGEGEKNETTQ